MAGEERAADNEEGGEGAAADGAGRRKLACAGCRPPGINNSQTKQGLGFDPKP